MCLAGSGDWLCPQGAASSGLSKQAELLFCPLHPSQGIVLMDLPTCCSSHPCTKLAGLEVPVRQLRAVSPGKDGGKTGPGLPSAEVELTLLSTGNGLLLTLTSQGSALVSKSFPSLLAKAYQHNSLDSTIHVLVCKERVHPSAHPCKDSGHRHQLTEQHLETAQAAW